MLLPNISCCNIKYVAYTTLIVKFFTTHRYSKAFLSLFIEWNSKMHIDRRRGLELGLWRCGGRQQRRSQRSCRVHRQPGWKCYLVLSASFKSWTRNTDHWGKDHCKAGLQINKTGSDQKRKKIVFRMQWSRYGRDQSGRPPRSRFFKKSRRPPRSRSRPDLTQFLSRYYPPRDISLISAVKHLNPNFENWRPAVRSSFPQRWVSSGLTVSVCDRSENPYTFLYRKNLIQSLAANICHSATIDVLTCKWTKKIKESMAHL